MNNLIKKINFTVFIFSLLISCDSLTKNKNPFGYTYNLKQQVTFDYSKTYIIQIGTILVQNKTNWKKKFHYSESSPKGYLFNTRTGVIHYVSLVTHSDAPRKMNFDLLGLLIGLQTYHIPVRGKENITLKVYINLNRFPKPGPAELVRYVKENKKDLEYHIFNPKNYPEPELSSGYPISKQETYVKPDWIIKEIRVINARPHAQYQYQ